MVIDDLTMSSNIFLQMEVREMERSFAATQILPFLNLQLTFLTDGRQLSQSLRLPAAMTDG